jgi:nucleoside-diphosphate-sugar epimerase
VIVGCGDVGLRLAAQLRQSPARLRIIATGRRPEQRSAIREAGAIPLACDLDNRRSLGRLAALSRWLIHLAPPPNEGSSDARSLALMAVCARSARRARAAGAPFRWSYVSTSGVYGDHQGAWVSETSRLTPANLRSVRRLAAERSLRRFGRRTGARIALLRAPGIYAEDRLPVERLRQGLPALLPEEDVFTNHIHAGELARACWLALWRGKPGRAYNVSDDTHMRMGEYFDTVADSLRLPRPKRLPMAELAQAVSPMMLSFMRESRRLRNGRMKTELRLRLRVPDVRALLASV